MADRRKKTKIVDSYVTLQAAQRRAQDRPVPTPSEADSAATRPDTSPRKPGTHIGRTVMPTKYEIVCYSCDFMFKITGKAKNTYCPKCRTMLDLADHTITGVCTDELVTAGRVTLSSSAVLDGGRITANDVKLEGTVKSGHLQVHHTLELTEGAVIPEEMIHTRNLKIAAGASISFKRKAVFRDVDVFGEFRANLWAEGLVTVHPGGHLKGKLHASHFTVLEGGGLTADVIVEPKKPQPQTKPSPADKDAHEDKR